MLSRILSPFGGVCHFLIYEDSHRMYEFVGGTCIGVFQNSTFKIKNDIAYSNTSSSDRVDLLTNGQCSAC